MRVGGKRWEAVNPGGMGEITIHMLTLGAKQKS